MPEENSNRNISKFARLSGIGLQMGFTIFIGAYFGKYLDSRFPSEKKWFTIFFTLLAVALSLYNVLRQVNRLNNEK